MLHKVLLSDTASTFLPEGLRWKAFKIVNRVRWQIRGFSSFLKKHFRRFRDPIQCHDCKEINKPLCGPESHYMMGVCPACSTPFEGVKWDSAKDYGESFEPRNR